MRAGQQQLRHKAAEIEDMVAASEVKDADNTKLWDQVCGPIKLESAQTLEGKGKAKSTTETTGSV